jgi:hypothetical protein
MVRCSIRQDVDAEADRLQSSHSHSYVCPSHQGHFQAPSKRLLHPGHVYGLRAATDRQGSMVGQNDEPAASNRTGQRIKPSRVDIRHATRAREDASAVFGN